MAVGGDQNRRRIGSVVDAGPQDHIGTKGEDPVK